MGGYWTHVIKLLLNCPLMYMYAIDSMGFDTTVVHMIDFLGILISADIFKKGTGVSAVVCTLTQTNMRSVLLPP